MEKLFKIGDVAALLDMTPQALRYYEQQHVIFPVKSENGTRYYTAYDVHRLIAFKKYRTMDFSMQDIMEYMRDRPMEVRSRWLHEKSEDLLRQSQQLYRSAQALIYYRHTVEAIEKEAGVFRRCLRRDCVIQNVFWEEMGDLPASSLDAIRAFINAMPVAALCFTADNGLIQSPRYRLGAEYEKALAWQLPLQDTIRLMPVPCVSTYLDCPSDYEIQPALSRAAEEAGRQGFPLDEKQQILCILITADTSKPVYHTYIKAYLPLRV